MNPFRSRLLASGTVLGLAWATPGVSASITGTNGNDFLFFSGAWQALPAEVITSPSGGTVTRLSDSYNLNNATYDGLNGNDTLLMSNYSDVIDERSGDVIQNVQTFIAGEGNDVLLLDNQGVGLTVEAGGGNDIVTIDGAGADSVHGRDGNDFIDTGAGNDIVFADAGNDTVIDGAGDDQIHLGSGHDALTLANDGGLNSVWVDSGGYDLSLGNFALSSVVNVLDSTLSGSVLNTLFEVVDGGSVLTTVSLFEDLSDPTATDGFFLFSDGSRYTRDAILGPVPALGTTVPLPASGLLLAGAMTTVAFTGRRRRRG